MMTEKRFTSERTDDYNFSDILDNGKWIGICHIDSADDFVKKFNELAEENEQLKKGMIEVVDRYIRNVEHNPPSSARTYSKVKGALNNVREGLRDILGGFE